MKFETEPFHSLKFITLLFSLSLFTNLSFSQDYHTPIDCLGDGIIDWGTGAGQVNWPEGSLNFTANNVRGTGHNFTFTVSGATSTLSDAASIGVTPPGIADWGHSTKSEDRVYFGTSGIGVGDSIEITIDISPSIDGNIGFDLYHFNQALNHGDHLTAYAMDDNNAIAYATYTGTATPNWTTSGEGPGEVESIGSDVGDNDQLGINFSAAAPIKQIKIIWADCNTCNPPDLHALSIGDIEFCVDGSDQDNDGIADYEDIDADNDGITDVMEICGSYPDIPSTSTVTVQIKTDLYPSETSWDIRDENNNVVASANGLTIDTSLYTWNETISAHEDYTFNIYDSYGDALVWVPSGYYNVLLDGVSIPGSNVTHDWGYGDSQSIIASIPPIGEIFDCMTSSN